MSDTPRTDAQISWKGNTTTFVCIGFARDLERELAEVKEQLRLCNVDQFTTAAELAEAKRNYMDLIMSVEKKYSNETRHQTALRYIREREKPSTDQAKCSAMKEGGK